MATVAASAPDKSPSFAAYLAARLPAAFLNAVRPFVNDSYEQAFKEAPRAGEEHMLPYWSNMQPHERNKLVFEHLHQLAHDLGLTVRARTLSNGYHFLEVEANGLVLHVKHFNNYQPLREQMVKADYRRQMTSINLPFGQMALFTEEKPVAASDAYVILFYEDGATNKREAGPIYFILPSSEQGNVLASCNLEVAIAEATGIHQGTLLKDEDTIDLPPKREPDADEQAQ